ncbi:AAA family ATPase [Wenxinia saemankumensis]|uniref:Pilus assembly protein CpaE n=1 Tax=Wenxinia saemankumensis TaxID=1447782 RepID=A0A1M6GUT0_9RHOB|nr:AAA family ATPase [Wenxinia saemankumensis]SHJ13697.1 pilus assembly protein CpaE [Wenxinia saemankumensis]
MSSTAALQPDPAPIVACTISRDVQNFDLLIEDMEALMGESWGDLSFADALAFLGQEDASSLEFVAIALDAEDEGDLGLVIDIVAAAKGRGIKVVLITEDVSPGSLHQLLREGGDEFVPYPLPEGELNRAVERLRRPPVEDVVAEEHRTTITATGDRSGVIIPVHGLAGGTGATMLAVNLAWELANADKDEPPRVALLDLDLQNGAVATYLDLPRREAVLELLTETEAMDSEAFMQALLTYEQRLQVLTAPADLVPLDLVGPAEVERILEMARTNFDYVVIDMPSTTVEWTETVLYAAHVYLATLELDMRSAQNTLRIKRAFQAEDLPFDKFRFVLNRAPGFTDLNGKSRVKRLAESLGISIEVQMPDGGKPVAAAADQGRPLALAQPKAALRKEIAKLAHSIHEINVGADAAQTRKRKRR